MSDSCVVTYTADCDDCGCDAEWTAIQRPAGNSLSVSCARCGKADRPVADVVPLRGVILGGGAQEMDVSVSVIPA